jgi:hypothetical protein
VVKNYEIMKLSKEKRKNWKMINSSPICQNSKQFLNKDVRNLMIHLKIILLQMRKQIEK